MIHDVDESLRALVKRDALNGSGVEVAFDAPDQGLGGAAQRAGRRHVPVRHPRGHVAAPDGVGGRARRDGPRHRTAPTAAALPAVVPRHRVDAAARGRAPPAVIDARLLRAARVHARRAARRLARGRGDADPDHGRSARRSRTDRSPTSWSAMGGELKPSLDLVVTAPMNVARTLAAGPPVLEEPRLVRRGLGRACALPRSAARAQPPASHADRRQRRTRRTLPTRRVVAGNDEQSGRHIRVRSLKT